MVNCLQDIVSMSRFRGMGLYAMSFPLKRLLTVSYYNAQVFHFGVGIVAVSKSTIIKDIPDSDVNSDPDNYYDDNYDILNNCCADMYRCYFIFTMSCLLLMEFFTSSLM